MYTKEQFLLAFQKEANIIKHLASKVEETHHTHQFTAKQRTIKELLAYFAYAVPRQVQLIFTGDMNLFADMQKLNEEFNPYQFLTAFDQEIKKALTLITEATDAQLEESVSLFGGFVEGKRGQLLIEFVFAQLCAYKMQLFLQLKHAGKEDLTSSNLRRGYDMPAKA